MSNLRALLLAVLWLPACDDSQGHDNPAQIEDQSGAVFGWTCDEERCHVTLVDGSPPLPHCNDDSRAIYGYTWGSVVTIAAGCTFDGGWGWPPGWEKLVVCQHDDNCPIIPGNGKVSTYVCDAGLCKSPEYAAASDALPNRGLMDLLCTGDEPRFADDVYTPALIEKLEAACPDDSFNSPCLSIPDGCRDPRG